jgi:hypothetical protein
MALLSPKKVYENLNQLDSGNPEKSAEYRQQAQEILANPNVSLRWRLAIADRLGQANNLLAVANITSDDSY